MFRHLSLRSAFVFCIIALTCVTLILQPGPAAASLVESRLIPGDLWEYAGFGRAVAISGSRLVVGASANVCCGQAEGAYVYLKDGATWQEEVRLFPGDESVDDDYGTAVAIDGDTVVVGAPDDEDIEPYAGSAYIFVRDAGGWARQAKLTASDAGSYDHFGYAVALKGDLLAVSATGINGVYIFGRSGGVWSEQARLSVGDAHLFGTSLAFNETGDRLAVGAKAHDTMGRPINAAYVFARTGGSWSQQARFTPTPSVSAGSDTAVALDESGTTLVVGSNQSGLLDVVYVYQHSGGIWSEAARLTASAAGATYNGFFGASLAISGDRLVIGAYTDDVGSVNSGAAYEYRRSGGELAPIQWRKT